MCGERLRQAEVGGGDGVEPLLEGAHGGRPRRFAAATAVSACRAKTGKKWGKRSLATQCVVRMGASDIAVN